MYPGIGLKHKHFQEVLEQKPAIGFLEVHTENFFAPYGYSYKALEKLREIYPLSAHSVGLSLGSADGISTKHLGKIKKFIDIFEPFLVSDHLSWSRIDNVFLNDLLPLPLTEETLKIVCDNIDRTQDFLGRKYWLKILPLISNSPQILLPEPEFLNQITRKTGCGILLDVNNIFVSSQNNDFSPEEYLAEIPGDIVGEVHLAGFAKIDMDGREMLIDDHGSRVHPPVWGLYRRAINKFGAKPTLIEWDTDVPELAILLEEAGKAAEIIESRKLENA